MWNRQRALKSKLAMSEMTHAMQTDDLFKPGYLGVWNPKPLDTPVHGEHVRHMPIVEPEPAGVHQHRPVVCVRRSENAKKIEMKNLQMWLVPCKFLRYFELVCWNSVNEEEWYRKEKEPDLTLEPYHGIQSASKGLQNTSWEAWAVMQWDHVTVIQWNSCQLFSQR